LARRILGENPAHEGEFKLHKQNTQVLMSWGHFRSISVRNSGRWGRFHLFLTQEIHHPLEPVQSPVLLVEIFPYLIDGPDKLSAGNIVAHIAPMDMSSSVTMDTKTQALTNARIYRSPP
jgi:hypothetical protein